MRASSSRATSRFSRISAISRASPSHTNCRSFSRTAISFCCGRSAITAPTKTFYRRSCIWTRPRRTCSCTISPSSMRAEKRCTCQGRGRQGAAKRKRLPRSGKGQARQEPLRAHAARAAEDLLLVGVLGTARRAEFVLGNLQDEYLGAGGAVTTDLERGEVGSSKKHTTKYQWQKRQQEKELAENEAPPSRRPHAQMRESGSEHLPQRLKPTWQQTQFRADLAEGRQAHAEREAAAAGRRARASDARSCASLGRRGGVHGRRAAGSPTSAKFPPSSRRMHVSKRN